MSTTLDNQFASDFVEAFISIVDSKAHHALYESDPERADKAMALLAVTYLGSVNRYANDPAQCVPDDYQLCDKLQSTYEDYCNGPHSVPRLGNVDLHGLRPEVVQFIFHLVDVVTSSKHLIEENF